MHCEQREASCRKVDGESVFACRSSQPLCPIVHRHSRCMSPFTTATERKPVPSGVRILDSIAGTVRTFHNVDFVLPTLLTEVHRIRFGFESTIVWLPMPVDIALHLEPLGSMLPHCRRSG